MFRVVFNGDKVCVHRLFVCFKCSLIVFLIIHGAVFFNIFYKNNAGVLFVGFCLSYYLIVEFASLKLRVWIHELIKSSLII